MLSRRELIVSGVGTIAGHVTAGEPVNRLPADWVVAQPQDVGLDAAGVLQVLEDGAGIPGLRCIVAARNQRLFVERYYSGAQSTDLMPVNSITKSVCSLLVGQAIAQGHLQSLEQTVAQLLPEAASARPQSPALSVTLGQILTGTSGLAYDWRRQLRDLVSASDPVAFVLALPSASRPGSSWSYNDAAVSLLTPILEKAQGMPMVEIAKRDLFTPLGIGDFGGRRDASGHAMAYMGLRMRPRDMLKVAAITCDGGTWGDKQVVPKTWVDDSTHAHTVPDWRIRPIEDPGYGYLWFTGSLAGQRVAWAWDYGGQFALVVPAQGLSVVTLAADPPSTQLGALQASIMALIARLVGAA